MKKRCWLRKPVDDKPEKNHSRHIFQNKQYHDLDFKMIEDLGF